MNLTMDLCTPEGMGRLMRRTREHLAAHNGNVRAAWAATKAAGSGDDDHAARFIDAADEPPEVPMQAFPPINEGTLKALEEDGVSPEVARELAEGDAAGLISRVRSRSSPPKCRSDGLTNL